MITIDQKVKVECTDTGVVADGVITRIHRDGFDVSLGTLTIRLKKYRVGIYVGEQAGMEFVVKTDV